MEFAMNSFYAFMYVYPFPLLLLLLPVYIVFLEGHVIILNREAGCMLFWTTLELSLVGRKNVHVQFPFQLFMYVHAALDDFRF